MKMITLSFLLIAAIFSPTIQAETMNGTEMILKKDLSIEANSTKHFGKKDIYNSGCAIVVQNRSALNLTIAKETVLVVDKVVSGVKKLEPGFPESEAITHIFMHIKEAQENQEETQDIQDELNNVHFSLSCESGIYYTKDEAFMAHVPPQKALKKFKDFIVQAK